MQEYPYLNPKERKKILILADDLRTHSGIGTMTKEFVRHTCHRFNYVQLGAAINHPENGKKVDVSEEFEKETGYKNLSIVIYPNNGYGDQDILRRLILQENPSAILLYTDPRYWDWVFQMEYEIRRKIPIFYYNIWDDTPPPFYNKPFYRSCDLLMNISKQTHNLVKIILGKNTSYDITDGLFQGNIIALPQSNRNLLSYVPHGINTNIYKPLSKEEVKSSKIYEALKNLMNLEDDSFVFFVNNRNIRRKKLPDIMMAFNEFSKNKSSKYKLLIHTEVVDMNGTDLPEVKRSLMPNSEIYFSSKKINETELNIIYNIADVTVNAACAEGFGLATAESLAAGTPIIVNVTGGLQDQCGFKKDDNKSLLTINDYDKDFQTNAVGKYKNHGEWVFPVYPKVRTLVGSPPTPYIYESILSNDDLEEAMLSCSSISKDKLEECGNEGRNFILRTDIGMSAKEMGRRFIYSMETALDYFKPKEKFNITGL